MGKSIDNVVLDAALNEIGGCTLITVCVGEPADFFEGNNPAAWVASTSYSLNDNAQATTYDGYSRKCITAGTSGGTEPSWNNTIGGQTNDGSVVWETVSLKSRASKVISGVFTLGDGTPSGRHIVVDPVTGLSVFAGGTVDHVALLKPASNLLAYVTQLDASQLLTAGNTASTGTFKYTIPDPA